MPDQRIDIIVADDNPLLLCVLSEILRGQGYAVRMASDGFEALAAIRERVPDVLLSDLNMPGMSGFELLSVVRRRFPMIAVIAMSGTYSSLAASPGIAADGFYAKGTSSVAQLFEILREIEDAGVRQAKRAAAPIWIPAMPGQSDENSAAVVACPECLRAFSRPLRGPALPQESSCPYCLSPVQLAIVKQSEKMDRTGLLLPAAQNMICDPSWAG